MSAKLKCLKAIFTLDHLNKCLDILKITKMPCRHGCPASITLEDKFPGTTPIVSKEVMDLVKGGHTSKYRLDPVVKELQNVYNILCDRWMANEITMEEVQKGLLPFVNKSLTFRPRTLAKKKKRSKAHSSHGGGPGGGPGGHKREHEESVRRAKRGRVVKREDEFKRIILNRRQADAALASA